MFRYVSKKSVKSMGIFGSDTKASLVADQDDENVFAVCSVIGVGSISKVRLLKKIKGKQENKLYALKIISMDGYKCPDPEAIGKKEQQKLQMLGYGVGGFFEPAKQKYKIIMDYMPGDHLFYLRFILVTPEIKLDVGIRLVQAIADLHDKEYVHLDIKPNNVMFDKTTSILSLIDFESAEKLINSKAEVKFDRRNPFFIAPELFNTNVVTKKWDIFSLGMTLAYWFGYDMQRNYIDGSVVFKPVMTDSGSYPDKFILSPQVRYKMYSLFLRMTDVDPDLRPDIHVVHDELKRIRLEADAAKSNLAIKSEGIDWSQIIIEDYRGGRSVTKKNSYSEVRGVDFEKTVQGLRDELHRLNFVYKDTHDDVAEKRQKLIQELIKKLQKEFDNGELKYQAIMIELTALRTEMHPAGWFPYVKDYVVSSTGARNIDKIKHAAEAAGFSLSRHV